MSSSSQRKETEIKIPFPSRSDHKIDLAGILSQHDPSSSASRRPLALILHGVLSHKSQSFHPLLASSLPIDSLRFDFRGNADSPLLEGQEWDMAGFHEDCRDLDAVVEWMEEEYGYQVEAIIGHSRGSLIGWKWMSEAYGDDNAQGDGAVDDEERRWIQTRRQRGAGSGRAPPAWVSLCGRWNMDRIHDRDQVYAEQFKDKGFFEWKAKVAGKQVTARVTPAAVESFASYPIASYVSRYPSHSPPLLIHGISDETVPSADVGYYINALSAKHARTQSGTGSTWGQVHLVEGANHMLRGKYDEVVAVIKQWYEAQRRGSSNEDGPQMALEASQEGDVLERSWNETGAGKGKL